MNANPQIHQNLATLKQPEPLSEAGKMIVTSHGDFHIKNITKDANGKVWTIDTDMAAVQYAV